MDELKLCESDYRFMAVIWDHEPMTSRELVHPYLKRQLGLPDYYGTTGIYADADGKAYLWLPEDWTTPVTPKLMSASATAHSFSANGYSYTVKIAADSGDAVAEKGEALKLGELKIIGFAVEDGWIVIDVNARPATWINGFADYLKVRASDTLPIPNTDDTLLDLSEAELRIHDNENATIAVPLPEGQTDRFFKGVEQQP